MSAVLEVFETGLQEALLKIDGIANAPTGELMEGIGRLVQGQTRRRITDEKTAPDGSAWKANRAGTSILYASGALADSIDYVASTGSVIVGSGLVYARIHQEGGVIKPKNGSALKFWWVSGGFVNFAIVASVTMPRRQHLGLSADNQNEIVETTEDWLSRLLQ
ncbi:phage virion morphogenesis protein [Shinella sp.]|uniref:phage virion morphogenesis protein n=1 Tax=Shinella sp. TaxID=1870904 RepID=UPI0039E2AE3D